MFTLFTYVKLNVKIRFTLFVHDEIGIFLIWKIFYYKTLATSGNPKNIYLNSNERKSSDSFLKTSSSITYHTTFYKYKIHVKCTKNAFRYIKVIYLKYPVDRHMDIVV